MNLMNAAKSWLATLFTDIIIKDNKNNNNLDPDLDNINLYSLIIQLGNYIITLIRQSVDRTTASTIRSSSNNSSSSSSSITCTSTIDNPMMNFTVGMLVIIITTWFIFIPCITNAFRLPSSKKTIFMNKNKEDASMNSKTTTSANINNKNEGHDGINSSSIHSNNRKKQFTFTPSIIKRGRKKIPTGDSKTNTNNDPNQPIVPIQSPLGSFKNVLNEVSSMFEERSTQVKKALEDFSQPFVGFTRNDSDYDEDVEEENDDDDNHYNENDHLEMTIIVEGKLNDDDDNDTTSNDPPIVEKVDVSNDLQQQNNVEQITHFCFLVHGYRGKPADLLYLRSAMASTAEKSFTTTTLSNTSNTTSSSSSTSTTSSFAEQNPQDQQRDENDDTSGKEMTNNNHQEKQTKKHRIVLHSCQSNWNRTSDGVEAGGERIFNEILTVIRTAMQNHTDTNTDTNNASVSSDDIIDVTMSLIGNSLGGLYSRYAIAKLAEFAQVQDDNGNNTNDINRRLGETSSTTTTTTTPSSSSLHSTRTTSKTTSYIIDGKIRIHFNIFCTTATPHLGVSGQTWLPLPRSAELGIGSLMGQTGRDIFRMSPLLKTMCTTDPYLKPLSSFRKRIAYANGYHTDFVVSTQTAAFLHPESTIPHHCVSSGQEDGGGMEGQRKDYVDGSGTRSSGGGENESNNGSNNSGMVVATLYTQASGDIPGGGSSKTPSISEPNNKTESIGGDGGKVDLRTRIPSLLVS